MSAAGATRTGQDQSGQGFDLQTVESVHIWLLSLDEAAVSRVPAPDVWSPKQVLGHLVDSAANNHARWARMVTEDGLPFPTWDQKAWNAVQDWQGEPWTDIVALWAAYNRHLARFQTLLPDSALGHRARVGTLGGGEPMTLAELLAHYARHLHLHLGQIRERVVP